MTRRTHNACPPASRAGKVAAGLLLIIVAFQAVAAAGAPVGEAAFGGANPGVLPDTLRVTSVIAGTVYLVLAAVAGTRLTGPTVRRRILYCSTALMVVGVFANIASPSLLERIIWTPVTIALVYCLWRAAGHPSLSPRPVRQDNISRPTDGPHDASTIVDNSGSST